ncbi:hypothetical protein BO71DRAFT_337820, partial [Aspergillus ellipticus CBS 707.79]
AFCAGCLAYVRSVDAMFHQNGQVEANRQFFKYALDKACHGRLYLTGVCLRYRYSLLADPARHMGLLDSPFEACQAIQAC